MAPMSRVRTGRSAIALVSALLVVAGGVRVFAASSDAESLITQGIQLRRQGHDQDALPVFKKAWETNASGRASAQLGLCEQALGLWGDAETHLQAALALTSDPWVRKNGATLREALVRVQARLASIDLWGTPAGARILVDGQAVGVLPLSSPIRVVDGSRVISIEASGFRSQSRTLDVKSGSALREHVALVPLPVATATPVAVFTEPPAADPESSAPGANLRTAKNAPASGGGEPAADGDHPFYKTWWFWTAVGVVVVAGSIVSIRALTAHNGCQTTSGGTCVTF